VHVALLLARLGQSARVVPGGAAATTWSRTATAGRGAREHEFGADVARIVAELTEDKSKSWEERKRTQVEHVPGSRPMR
jgi:(p)ppGpp synthase/HD superfamily hydrolase